MYFDVAMPLTLFAVTIATMFLEKKIKDKLKSAFEEKDFGVRDAVLLVASMSAAISLIVFIPQLAVMIIFLFAYSLLLFIFTYLFSDLQKIKANLFYMTFLVASFAVATISLFNIGINTLVSYGAIAFFCLFGCCFMALVYEKDRTNTKERWYLAVLPPALFILLYVFFSRTPIWFPYLIDIYGVIFAVLVILYLGTLFAWKTTLIFTVLLTVMDIILVLFTGTMVSAARHVSGLALPILISIPTLPVIATERGILYMSLGLGDFFFAGLIGIQTMKKYGWKTAILSAITMCLSFFIFEILLLNFELTAFPGTLMIICGWLLIVLIKESKNIFTKKMRKNLTE